MSDAKESNILLVAEGSVYNSLGDPTTPFRRKDDRPFSVFDFPPNSGINSIGVAIYIPKETKIRLIIERIPE